MTNAQLEFFTPTPERSVKECIERICDGVYGERIDIDDAVQLLLGMFDRAQGKLNGSS